MELNLCLMKGANPLIPIDNKSINRFPVISECVSNFFMFVALE
jgi:hypothetical protein